MAFYPNDMLTSAYLIGAVNQKPSNEAERQKYQVLKLLPWLEVPERTVFWDIVRSENNLAGFYSPKGEAVPGDDVIFQTAVQTLTDIKASRTLDTWASEQLRDPGEITVYRTGSNAGKSRQQKLRDHINGNLAWCNAAVDSQIEYIGMHWLQGSVVWPPVDNNGNAISPAMPHWNATLTLNVSTGLPANQIQNVTTLTGHAGRTGAGLAWTNASSTPFNDMEIIEEYMVETLGISLRGGTVLMSSVDIGYLARNTSVLNFITGANKEQPGARSYADFGTLQNAVQTIFGWNLVPYDAQWTYRNNAINTASTTTRVKFLPEGKVIFLPPGGPVGRMMTAQQMTKERTYVYGKMGWEYQTPKPPFDIELGVNAVVWPQASTYDWFVLSSRN